MLLNALGRLVILPPAATKEREAM
ncbi:hypothetical protein NGA_0139200, partial [Nannochloropsis gaditana CCMP526]